MPETARARPTLRERRIRRVGEQAAAPSNSQITLVETLDRVLRRGIVVHGEVVLTVANVPLVYVGLQAMVSAVETAQRALEGAERSGPRRAGGVPENHADGASKGGADRR